LFLPVASYRSSYYGSLDISGGYGLIFDSDNVYLTFGSDRATGFSVRCVAD
jgi:hypothetical protein